MARIKLSPLISSINGKLGNAVFQGGKSGIILREKVKPRDRNTSKQVIARNRLSQIKSAWQNLNTSQKNSWISFASFYNRSTKNNATKSLSPYELFIQANSIRFQGNFDILETTSFELTSVELVDMVLVLTTPTVLTLSLAMVPEDFIDNVTFYVSKPFRQSASIAKSEVRFLLADANDISQENITDRYLDLFHRLPVAGEKVLVKVIGFKNLSGWTSRPIFTEVVFS